MLGHWGCTHEGDFRNAPPSLCFEISSLLQYVILSRCPELLQAQRQGTRQTLTEISETVSQKLTLPSDQLISSEVLS